MTGVGAVVLDVIPCIRDHDKAACAGALLGGIGATAGAGVAFGGTRIMMGALDVASTDAVGQAAITQGFNVFSLVHGVAGTLLDGLSAINAKCKH